MSLMRKIELKIRSIPEGQLIKYEDFGSLQDDAYALSKALSRLCNKGIIERYRRGIYYKPRITAFGILGPSEQNQIDLILNDKKVKGYISGSTIYNEWGVTTQVANEIVIVTAKPRKNTKIGNVFIKYSKGVSPKKKNSIRKLQLLDIIKDFKKIPDRNDCAFISVVKKELLSFKKEDLNQLTTLALKYYKPGTRALLGAILDMMKFNKYADSLKRSLNKLSVFDIGISSEFLPNKKDWQII